MKLLRVSYTRNPRVSCEACGHPGIRNLYHVEMDGKTIVIGSECAKSLLGFTMTQLLNRYERQSAKEWKKNPQEERGDYIARRINEKIVARKAWESWKSIASSYAFPNCWPSKEFYEQKIQEVEARFSISRADWLYKTAYEI